MYNFYYQVNPTTAVLAIPRCGSESIASLGPHLSVRQVKLLITTVVAFIRDPLDRCVSGYRFFRPFPNDPRFAVSYEAWVDRFLDQPDGIDYSNQIRVAGRVVDEPTFLPVDPHWKPQATLISEAPVAPTTLQRFERLALLFPDVKHYHNSRPFAADTTYRQAEVLAYYAADTALRNGL